MFGRPTRVRAGPYAYGFQHPMGHNTAAPAVAGKPWARPRRCARSATRIWRALAAALPRAESLRIEADCDDDAGGAVRGGRALPVAARAGAAPARRAGARWRARPRRRCSPSCGGCAADEPAGARGVLGSGVSRSRLRSGASCSENMRRSWSASKRMTMTTPARLRCRWSAASTWGRVTARMHFFCVVLRKHSGSQLLQACHNFSRCLPTGCTGTH